MATSTASEPARSHWPVTFWYLLAAAVAIRVVLIVVSLNVHTPSSHPAEQSDMQQYMSGGEYFANGMSPPGKLLPQRDRLLPIVLGGVFAFTGRSIPSAQITDMILALSGLFVLFPLARMLLPDRLALAACGVWVFDPQFVGQSCLPLSENLATPLYILALYCLARSRTSQSIAWFVLASAVLAIAVWARASTILLAGAVLIWILFWPRPFLHRAGLIAVMLIFVGGSWLAASAMSYRLFGFFAPNSHTSILWDNAANKLMVQTGQARDLDDARQKRRASLLQQLGPDASLADRMARSRANAIELVREHPGLQIRNHVQAFVATAFMPDRWSMTSLLGIKSSGGIWHARGGLSGKIRMVVARWGWPTIAYAIVHFVFTLLIWWWALRSIPLWIRGENRAVFLLLALAVAAILTAGVINVEGMPRYRLPAMPMLAVLAACGFMRASGRTPQPSSAHE